MIFQFLCHFSFGETSVLWTFHFWWHFSFGDISVLETFQFLVTSQFWWHFSFGDISGLVTFQVWFGWLSIYKGLSNIAVCQALQITDRLTDNYANIGPIKIFFVWLVGIWNSGDLQVRNTNIVSSNSNNSECNSSDSNNSDII